MEYPKCDKCKKMRPDVVCYEGYGVGIRLCPTCEKKTGYLNEMNKLNREMSDAKAINTDLNGNPINVSANAEKRVVLKAKAQSFKEKM